MSTGLETNDMLAALTPRLPASTLGSDAALLSAACAAGELEEP